MTAAAPYEREYVRIELSGATPIETASSYKAFFERPGPPLSPLLRGETEPWLCTSRLSPHYTRLCLREVGTGRVWRTRRSPFDLWINAQICPTRKVVLFETLEGHRDPWAWGINVGLEPRNAVYLVNLEGR